MPKRPGPDPSVDNIKIIQTIVADRKPVLGTSEIAERIDLSRQATTRHLKRMEENDLLESAKIGPVVVWWPTNEGLAQLDPDLSDSSSQ